MKYLMHVIITLLVSLVGFSSLNAQEINQQRMQRDINILESALEEMFKTQWETPGNRIQVFSGKLSFGNNNKVTGTYLPGFGVLFSIPAVSTGYINYKSDNDKKTNYNKFISGEKVTKESIIKLITEFLGDYGSIINQLSDNDKIMVIYNTSGPKNVVMVGSQSKDEILNIKPSQNISVIADYSNIQGYQSNNINADEFKDRLKIYKTSKDKEKESDLKIMASILETAFEDQGDKQFKISNDIEYQLIENLGALYSFNISYGGIFNVFGISNSQIVKLKNSIATHINLDSLKLDFDFDSLKGKPLNGTLLKGQAINPADSSIVLFDSTYFDKMGKKLKSISVKLDSISGEWGKTSKEAEEDRKKRKVEMQQDLDQFLTKLKNYLVDYGSTINSISSKQYLITSIKIRNNDDLPERIVLQVKKSVLEAVKNGSLSRSQAINKITVREY